MLFCNENNVVILLFMYMSLFLIYETNAIRRTFYSPEMCLGDDVKDCSFQFPGAHKNSCLIYETDVCRKYDFSAWNLKPLVKPASEADSEFTVSIVPYDVYVLKLQFDPVSALNISLTILNKGITGFSIVLTNDEKNLNICRIFDFRNSLSSFDIPVNNKFTLFYDCFRKLTEDGWKIAVMTFRAYPLNIEMSYLVYLPINEKINSSPACNWKPLVMIHRERLEKNDIQLKFSNAPKMFGITSFVVILWSSSGTEIQRSMIPFNFKQDMVPNAFIPVEDGVYLVTIDIVSSKETCPVFRSSSFLVGVEPKNYTLIVFIVLVIVMIISGSALLYLLCRWYLKSVVPLPNPTVLLVYNFTLDEDVFLTTFGKDLENCYGVKVNSVYRKSGDPKVWRETKYLESDVIVFVVSEGLYETLEKKKPTANEHHMKDQVHQTVVLVNNLDIGKKRICKICFSFRNKKYVPSCLEHKGPLFTLPDEKDKFLCFIHGCSKTLYLLNKLCCKIHHKIGNSNLKYDEVKVNEKSLYLTENNVDASPLISVRNPEKCSLKVEFIKEPNISDEKCNFTASDSDLNEHKMQDVSPAKQISNLSSTENDDPILYCTRKLLNS